MRIATFGLGFLLILFSKVLAAADRPASQWVFVGMNGQLQYHADAQGNRIPDFSNCGYRGGGVVIPTPAVTITINPTHGEMTVALQKAIDQLSKLKINADGFRGVLLLKRGQFTVTGTLKIRASGIVIRGEGQGTDGTVLLAQGNSQHNLFDISGTDSRGYDDKHVANITDEYVPVGATAVTVDDVQQFHVGQTIWVDRPATPAWLKAIGMDRIPPHRTPVDHDSEAVQQWDNTYHLRFDRVITAMAGNHITIDAPLTNAFEKQFGGGMVYPYHFEGRIENVGIENLRVDSSFAGKEDEKHGWIAINLTRIQNAWVRNVTSVHFGFGLVNIDRDVKWITVQDCSCLDPVSEISGGRRYSFNIAGELSLVQRCYSREGRHDFAIDSLVPGPNVFLACRAENAHDDAGPHHRWSCGTLFDNVQTHCIDFENRLNMGSGHGWAGANSVMWNCKVDEFRLQQPPTANNWAIGTLGKQVQPYMIANDEYRTMVPDSYFKAHPTPDAAWGFDSANHGTISSPGLSVGPESLYLAQLRNRLGTQAVKNIGGEYRLVP